VPAELVTAILGHRQVQLLYPRDPRPPAPRVVNPHAVYESSSGQLYLQGVQVAGPSSHGEDSLPGWRTFTVGLIAGAEVLPTGFEVAPDFRPGSPLYHRMIIDCLRGWRPAAPGRR
jgi:hypothetical protein